MKHRKDWTAWKKNREAELRSRRRATQDVLNRMLEHWLSQPDTEEKLLACLKTAMQAPLFVGRGMMIPFIYGEKRP